MKKFLIPLTVATAQSMADAQALKPDSLQEAFRAALIQADLNPEIAENPHYVGLAQQYGIHMVIRAMRSVRDQPGAAIPHQPLGIRVTRSGIRFTQQVTPEPEETHGKPVESLTRQQRRQLERKRRKASR